MTTTIYYFTATGNSFTAARSLAEHLKDAEFLPISRYLKSEKIVINTERVGLVFPVYFGKVPDIVTEFIDKMVFQRNPYLFAVATCNGEPMAALQILKNQFNRMGQKLSYGYCLDMPGNAAVTPDYLTKQRLSQYEGIIKELAKQIENREEKDSTKHMIENIKANLLHWFGIRYLSPDRFIVSDHCIGCGVCVKACAVRNITLDKEKSRFGERIVQDVWLVFIGALRMPFNTEEGCCRETSTIIRK